MDKDKRMEEPAREEEGEGCSSSLEKWMDEPRARTENLL